MHLLRLLCQKVPHPMSHTALHFGEFMFQCQVLRVIRFRKVATKHLGISFVKDGLVAIGTP